MSDRIRHFRAGLLLTFSSTLLIWPISYWFPLGDFLTAINIEDYADYKLALEGIIGIYLAFFVLNLVTACLSATKINYKVKFWLSVIPALFFLATPVLFVLPIAANYPNQTFLEVLQAIYSLLRFNSTQLVWLVIFLSMLSAAINFMAALIFKTATNPERLPKHLSNRYITYLLAVLVIFALTVFISSSSASSRDTDRKACQEYSSLLLPEYDDQLETFVVKVRLISSQSGSKELETHFNRFLDLSSDYLSLVISEPDNSAQLAQYGLQINAVRGNIEDFCSELSVK